MSGNQRRSLLAARSRPPSSAAVLAVLSTAAFMASLDLFIVNVAFPSIASEFTGSSTADLSWVLSAYSVLYAALLVPLGRLADRYGRLRGFLAGLFVFTAASAACAFADNLWSLVAFRGLQAVGAAALTPSSVGLLLAATPAAKRARAVRIWAAAGAAAGAMGPPVGGLLVQASWRWIFLVNIPVGLLGLVLAARIVPDSRDDSVTGVPDLLGAALVAGGVGSVVLALVKSPSWGWGSARTLGALAAGALCLVAFVRRSARHPLPVVELPLLRLRTFAWSNVSVVLYAVGFGGSLLAAVLWMQDVWGWSALATGLAIMPGPVMVPITSAVAQRLSGRVSTGWLAFVGCALFGAGAAFIALRIGPDPNYMSQFLPGWMLAGAGAGLAMPTLISAATADLPPARRATGSAVVTMARQVGLTLGVSLLIAIVGTPATYASAQRALRDAWLVLAVIVWVGAFTALQIRPATRRHRWAWPASRPSVEATRDLHQHVLGN